ncbi:protein-glutamate O-methyltransferase CheR [Ammoniphilus sp. CFH 90114]|uniref:CheR family methyltransferase n=1 Tax=Ammoniphilus sp. CFH 90114 TaxID=2493665 RepID=UPI00196BA8B0|nr:protein-glutamate O-methyltransferase CheR [Ammoniphilus sp. CFH 90114]
MEEHSNLCSDLEKLEIELLLEGIYRHYGFDFRNYAFSSIRRRIWHRIQAEKLSTVTSLLDKVLHDKKIMDKLFADFSINVTEMFRDPSFFHAFRTKVVPLLQDLPSIRIWHAGCSTGEEVYSMAILLHEEGLYHKTRIYGTDINDKVLQQAKTGQIPIHRMQSYTSNYVLSGGTKSFSEYYTAQREYVRFHPFLGENLVFAQHNLVTDGSFNEFHVIICRNVMIYFNRDLQERVQQLIYESLGVSGILGLGSREGLSFTPYAHCYEEMDSLEKIYRKIK